MTRLRFFLLCATLALAGCSDDGGMADDTGVGDTGGGDTGMSDTGGTDTGAGDTGVSMDAAMDGGDDAGDGSADAASDAAADATSDASADATSDASADATSDGSADAASDAAADATSDASADAGTGDCGGVVCDSTEYCDYTTDFVCFGAGTCMTRPGVCPLFFDPHCGCDGVTYDNACGAHAAGQDVAAPGACP